MSCVGRTWGVEIDNMAGGTFRRNLRHHSRARNHVKFLWQTLVSSTTTVSRVGRGTRSAAERRSSQHLDTGPPPVARTRSIPPTLVDPASQPASQPAAACSSSISAASCSYARCSPSDNEAACRHLKTAERESPVCAIANPLPSTTPPFPLLLRGTLDDLRLKT